MKIESGKFYRTRDGRKVGPIVRHNSDDFTEEHDRGQLLWRADGLRYFRYNRGPTDLVAEWTDGPVREVTRIVPGVYGRIKVIEAEPGTEPEFGSICIQLVNRNGRVHGERDPDPALMTPDELRAAAAVLIEIADALPASEASSHA